MKRAVCVVLTMVFLFCSCGKPVENKPPSYSLPLTGTVRIHTELTQMTADFHYSVQEVMTFSFTKPEELQGMTVRCSATENEMFHDKVTVPLGDKACFPALRKAMNVLLTTDLTPTETPEGWMYDCTSSHGFTLEQSADGRVLNFLFADGTKATVMPELPKVTE